jgi:hypothetical protein
MSFSMKDSAVVNSDGVKALGFFSVWFLVVFAVDCSGYHSSDEQHRSNTNADKESLIVADGTVGSNAGSGCRKVGYSEAHVFLGNVVSGEEALEEHIAKTENREGLASRGVAGVRCPRTELTSTNGSGSSCLSWAGMTDLLKLLKQNHANRLAHFMPVVLVPGIIGLVEGRIHGHGKVESSH